MDGEAFRAGREAELLEDGGERAHVSRHLALEREKEELRRERDHVMLDLAASLGPAELARRFGVDPPVIAKLLAGARGRLNRVPAEGEHARTEISARRVRTGQPRWMLADAHYEALGRTSG